MESSEVDRYELIGRILLWLSGAVFLLSVIGAVVIAGSDTQLPFAEEVERQGRGVFALASIGIGVTAGGVLAGLGAVVSMMAADHRRRLRLGEPAASQALRDLGAGDEARGS
jgi:hypothetical protein